MLSAMPARPRDAKDHVDRIIEQWKRVRPGLDIEIMAIPGRIRRISRLVERSLEETFSRFGLGRGGFDVLAALRRSGPPYQLSPTDLYSSLLVSSGAMTNRIDRLEEAGLVERHADPDDRRGILVGLTPAGQKRIDVALDAVLKSYVELFHPLSAREQRTLADLLRKVMLHLREREEPLPPPEDEQEAVGAR